MLNTFSILMAISIQIDNVLIFYSIILEIVRMPHAFLQKILSLNIILAMSNKNSERGRIHRDFLWYMAFQGMATWTRLWDYSNMIPCQECKNHFTDWLSNNRELEDFDWSRKQMQMLYGLYRNIQHRNDKPAKDFDTRFSFYFNRLILD